MLHVLPVDSNKVFFSSFRGQYNDNPKYISIRLHEEHPEIEQYWAISEKSTANDLPDYIKIVHYNTLPYCWYKNRCKVIVENGAGSHIFYLPYRKKSIKLLLKNKKQYDISTWHGNPIKHIGAQIPENYNWNNNTFHTTSDVIFCGCEYVKEIFEKAFLSKMPIRLIGTPRTDILFDLDESKKVAIKEKLKLPATKKIVLYAPTYRNNPEDSGIIQMQMMDFERLFDALNDRFGGDWCLVFRVHNMVLLKIDTKTIAEKYGDKVINGNEFDDMMEYMAASDALITDYSGCIFDVAHTMMPCFLFAHDRQKYQEVERGTYITLDELPYEFSDSFEDLENNIRNFNELESRKRVLGFQSKIGNIEDGKASQRACELIFSKLKGE